MIGSKVPSFVHNFELHHLVFWLYARWCKVAIASIIAIRCTFDRISVGACLEDTSTGSVVCCLRMKASACSEIILRQENWGSGVGGVLLTFLQFLLLIISGQSRAGAINSWSSDAQWRWIELRFCDAYQKCDGCESGVDFKCLSWLVRRVVKIAIPVQVTCIMARLQRQLLRSVYSFLNLSSAECLGVACRGFATQTPKSFTFSTGLVSKERNCKVLAGLDLFKVYFNGKYSASGIRVFSAESGEGGDGEEKVHHLTKIDGGKKYSVVQIDTDGSWKTVWRNAMELVSPPQPLSGWNEN